MEQSIREQAVLQTLGAVEAAVDQNMNAIDNLGEDDFETLRQKRLQQMKERQQKIVEWRKQGHGTYSEIRDEREFFETAKKSERVLVHFYRPASKYCVYMDKQLQKLSRVHMEAKHVKINAEKCPYLCEKLNIVTLPSVVLVKNRKTEHTCIGFDEFGGHEAPTAYFAAIFNKHAIYEDQKESYD